MRRVCVIGNTGSGKTTVSRAIAARLAVPCVELDELHWGPNWEEASADELIAKLSPIVAQDAWVIDGMYFRKIGGLVLRRADTVVWVDPPWLVTFARLLRRSLSRVIRRTQLYNGNRETFWNLFHPQNSLLLFAIRTGRRRRELLSAWLARPDFAHLHVIRFASLDDALRWVETL
ncbi:MAG TPA: hypothetical protein VEU77_07040 [Candidatus Acidoferrales bacterium]|nr:hypothetical protein [Candidatus Acidoferrales bacterium]